MENHVYLYTFEASVIAKAPVVCRYKPTSEEAHMKRKYVVVKLPMEIFTGFKMYRNSIYFLHSRKCFLLQR